MTVEQDDKAKTKAASKKLKLRVEKAEAKKAEIELRRAEIGLELEEIRADQYRHEANLKANADSSHGIFNLEKAVGRTSVDLAGEIRQFTRTYPDAPVTLNIFSPGGSVFDGLVLYDTLRTIADQGHLVTTVARGMAASMGSLLFLAGDNRLIGSEAMVMFHGLSAGTGGSIYSMEEDLAFYKKIEERLDRIVFERTKVTPALLARKTKKKDWWLDAAECLKLKVATGRG